MKTIISFGIARILITAVLFGVVSVRSQNSLTDGLVAYFHYARHHNTEELRHIMGNSPSVIDRFYKGAISNLEVEKF